MKKKVVDPRFARGREYRGVIRKIAEKGHCPFCPENFKYHKHPTLRRAGRWFITKSSWPYKNTRFHFLILGTAHKEKFEELSLGDWRNITALAGWAIKKFKIRGGGLALRFGETVYMGATVCHLHAHLIVPNINPKTKKAKTVVFSIG